MTMTAQETADGLMDEHAPLPIASTNLGQTIRRREAFRDAILAALLAERKAALAEAAGVAQDRFDVPPTEESEPVAFHVGWEACARTIARAILALSPGYDWLPIETAPKDRTPVVVFQWMTTGGAFYDVAYFSEWNGDDYQPAWYSSADDSPSCDPTHWRPLPSPPIDHTPEEET